MNRPPSAPDDDRDPNAPREDAGGHGDLHAKTLALLRRLLIGNGYRAEEIQLSRGEGQDIIIPGRFNLELTTQTQMARTMGLPRGGEDQVFQVREHFAGYMSRLQATLTQDTTWVEEVRALTASRPEATWGTQKAQWPLPRLSQVVALVLPCDLCRGQKYEICQICNGQRETVCQRCYQQGRVTCPTCRGTGSDPQSQSGRPCPQCNGIRTLVCPDCRGAGRQLCHACNGTGQTVCRECQGHGFFTERTQVQVFATGHFQVGGASVMPPASVIAVVDQIGVDNLKNGHAAITLDPGGRGSAEPAIFTRALLPYAKLPLKLREETLEVEAVGFRPVLADFPPLLDELLKPVLPRLEAGTLPKFCRQFRIIRELSEALAVGAKPRDFFSRRYPYGLTPPVAMALTQRIRGLFTTVTKKPRAIAAGVSGLLALNLIYLWLYNPRPAFLPPDLPIYIWDIGVIVLLALLCWGAVEMAGRRALRRILPPATRIAATGGLIGWGVLGGVLLCGAFFLWWPDTRPEWVAALLT